METNARDISPQNEPPAGWQPTHEKEETPHPSVEAHLPSSSEIHKMKNRAEAHAASEELQRTLEEVSRRQGIAELALDDINKAWVDSVETKKLLGIISYKSYDAELGKRRGEAIRNLTTLNEQRAKIYDLLRELDIQEDELGRAETKHAA